MRSLHRMAPGQGNPLSPGPFNLKGLVSNVVPIEALLAIIAIPTGLTGLFLRFFTVQRALDRKEHAADRLVWENHLSGTVRILQSLVDEVRELRREIK